MHAMNVIFLIAYAFVLVFILVMFARFVRAVEKIADNFERGIRIHKDGENLLK